jgi:hypothetical protein
VVAIDYLPLSFLVSSILMDNYQLFIINYQLFGVFNIDKRSHFYSPYSDKNTRKSLKAALVFGELSS